MSEPELETVESFRKQGFRDKPFCHGCQRPTDAVVLVGEDDYDDPRTCRLCLECIDKARSLLLSALGPSSQRQQREPRRKGNGMNDRERIRQLEARVAELEKGCECCKPLVIEEPVHIVQIDTKYDPTWRAPGRAMVEITLATQAGQFKLPVRALDAHAADCRWRRNGTLRLEFK